MITLEKDKNWRWMTETGGDIEICCPQCDTKYRMDQPVGPTGKVLGFVLCPAIADADDPDYCYCRFKGFVTLGDYDGGLLEARHVPEPEEEAVPPPAAAAEPEHTF